MSDLDGLKIAVTRPTAQAADLMSALRGFGATILSCPVIRIAPPDDALALAGARRRAKSFDWIIFTSANAVEHFLGGGGVEDLPSVAAIGPATAAALGKHGITPDFIPEHYLASAIPAGLGDLAGERVLLPRADIAGNALPEALAQGGANVTEVAAYQTLKTDPGDGAVAKLPAGVDAVTFTSPSTVRGLVAALEARNLKLDDPLAACIGPITAKAVADAGFTQLLIAPEHSAAGLVDALREHFRNNDGV